MSKELNDGDHVVELVVSDSPTTNVEGSGGGGSEEIMPLLSQTEKPKINIFSVTYSRQKIKEQVTRLPESETSPLTQFVLWVWSGSRYSGLLCMAVSSIIYFVMGLLSDRFSGKSQPIPLFESAFARCIIVSILSFIWLRRSGQPLFGPPQARKPLFLRALAGFLSLMSFIYSIQRLPLSQAIVLSFTTPIMASIMARIMLAEKLKIAEVGVLACSFFGVLFIFRQILTSQGRELVSILCSVWFFTGTLVVTRDVNYTPIRNANHTFSVLVGLFSSIIGGVSYCLVRNAAKASDQPVTTVLSFSIVATPLAGICAFAFEKFILPDLQSISFMIVLGISAFFVEVFLARGLQLEKTSKATNMLYIQAALSQLWSICTTTGTPIFGGLIGCLLILVSVSCTIYMGAEKEIE